LRHLSIFVVLLVCWARPAESQLRTFYVATNGNNAHAGSSASPWLTLQHAANTVQAGDLVIVRPGTYTGFQLETSGTQANPIEFRAEAGVTVNVPNPVRGNHGINLEGASWVTIQGFTVIDMPRAGIRAVLNEHVTIRGNTLNSNGYWGVLTGFSDDVLIEDNTASNSEVEHGIYVSNSGDRPVIRRNHIFGNNANGIHMNGDASAGGDGIISGALVEGNRIHDNGNAGGSGINCDGVQTSRFQNNVLYNNHAGGITLYRIDAGASAINNVVAHNTILQASNGRWAINITNASTGNTVHNNILYNAHSFRGSITVSDDSLPGLTSDYNVVMDRFSIDDGDTRITLAQWRAETGQDQHSFIDVPANLFKNVAANDYHLKSTSPARDAGLTLAAVTSDYDGVPRPSGPGVDIGAYEIPAGTSFTDDPLVAFTTPVRAVHLSELRSVINTLRAGRSLSAMAWTDPAITAGVTSIRAIHLAELRSALDAVYVADGLSPPSWTPALVAGVTPVTAAQIEQVRQAVRAVE
jgi:parallel beta-helix repeat protein